MECVETQGGVGTVDVRGWLDNLVPAWATMLLFRWVWLSATTLRWDNVQPWEDKKIMRLIGNYAASIERWVRRKSNGKLGLTRDVEIETPTVSRNHG